MPDDSDDDDDLDDLYGEDTVVRGPECHSGDEGSNRQSDTDSVEDEPSPPQHPVRRTHSKKTLTLNRLVHSIDSCMDKCNFNEITLPENTLGTNDEEEILTGYLGPKSNVNTPKIHWTTTSPLITGRQRSCDVVKSAVSTVRYGDVLIDIRSVFSTLITEEMVNLIVEKTNIRLEVIMAACAEKIAGNFRYNWIRKTDATEIHALIGLCYLRGLLGQNNHSRNILFKNEIGHPLFAAVMSKNRFCLLISNLMFDTNEERVASWPFDRFAAIRTLFETFNQNCLKHVIPSEFLSIDETLYPMRNQVAMKQYNPNKPAKYGLLFKSLNDGRFPYTYNSLVYAGKPQQGDGPYYINTIEDHVKTLVRTTGAKLPLDGRNISMDRLYTSVSTAIWLREQKITVVGTLMMNRIGIPDEIKAVRNRENFSVTIHFEEEKKDLALMSYNVKTKSKGKKNVLMLTTMRPCLGVTKDDGKEKPALYKLYDFTKGGTDIVDQNISYYTSKAKSVKWKMVAFYFMLDTARVNSQTILALKEKKDARKTNSFEIGFCLELERRSTKGLQKNITRKIDLYVNRDDDNDDDGNAPQLFTKLGDKHKICITCSDDISGP